MAHLLAVINILGGFLLIMAAVDFLSGYPRINIGSAAFWGAIGVVLIYNGFRIFP